MKKEKDLSYKDEIILEKTELEIKFKKLDNFILDNPNFLKISIEEKNLLENQKNYMSLYLMTLEKRINFFKTKK